MNACGCYSGVQTGYFKMVGSNLLPVRASIVANSDEEFITVEVCTRCNRLIGGTATHEFVSRVTALPNLLPICFREKEGLVAIGNQAPVRNGSPKH